MILSKIAQINAARSFTYIHRCRNPQVMLSTTRTSTHYKSGALKPMPSRLPFGVVFIFCVVVPGLFIGAAISRSVANFLEENELFVVSDEDDDDED